MPVWGSGQASQRGRFGLLCRGLLSRISRGLSTHLKPRHFESASKVLVAKRSCRIRPFLPSGDTGARRTSSSRVISSPPRDSRETPLHSPNLFAAGHGAVADALAWRIAGREADRSTARHWLRSILPFTHLW